jgi:tripartite-type tricarboxylate transporter receptor subunit TctC
VPTIAEGGLPGYEANNWYGLLAPAKTPAAIIERLNREVVKVLNMPKVKEQLFRSGLDASPSTPKEFSDYVRAEIDKWRKIVHQVRANEARFMPAHWRITPVGRSRFDQAAARHHRVPQAA